MGIAIIVVAVLLFADGYALGMLNGQKDAPSDRASSVAASTSLQAPASASSTASDPAHSSGAHSEASSSHASSKPASTTSAGSTQDAGSAQDASSTQSPPGNTHTAAGTIDEQGHYTSKDDVALYIHTYGHLPSNFVSKTKAKKAGWVASKGNLADVLPGMSIGGSEFYNDEGLLPTASGRTWTECDINYTSGRRGAERIVFSNDGLIFYTADHYKTFEQLY